MSLSASAAGVSFTSRGAICWLTCPLQILEPGAADGGLGGTDEMALSSFTNGKAQEAVQVLQPCARSAWAASASGLERVGSRRFSLKASSAALTCRDARGVAGWLSRPGSGREFAGGFKEGDLLKVEGLRVEG